MNVGQFNTTNKGYILSGFEYFVPGKNWVDPYAGNGDLLEWAYAHGASSIEGYDVDASKVSGVVKQRDTLLAPVDLSDKFLIANPPFLARNKNKDKTLYDKYGQDDLYKIAVLTTQSCLGGIFILPVNMLSSLYANSIRDIFFKNFEILRCKIFEESVFANTDYTVCAFLFQKKAGISKIPVIFSPSSLQKEFSISEKHHWILGEEFYEYLDGVNFQGIGRWTEKNGLSNDGICGKVFINDFVKKKVVKDDVVTNGPKFVCFKPEILEDIILLRSIDTGTHQGRIGLYDIRKFAFDDVYPVLLGLETSRNLAHVRFEKKLSIDRQLEIIGRVNEKLEDFRQKYNSVFLTAFRNSTKEYSRKRISFEVVYQMISKENATFG